MIDLDDELSIAATRPDGTECTPQIIWHVVVDNALYIRSVRGTGGAWYRGVQRVGTIDTGGVHSHLSFVADDRQDDAVDQACCDEYGNGNSVRAITSPEARATTLRVDPVEGGHHRKEEDPLAGGGVGAGQPAEEYATRCRPRAGRRRGGGGLRD